MALPLINAVTKAGANICLVGRYGEEGFLTSLDGTAIANGDQDGNGGLTQFPLVKAVPIGIPENESIPITGDDGTAETFSFEAGTLPEFIATFGAFDLDHQAYLQGTNVVDYGLIKMGGLLPENPEYPSLMMLIQSKAKAWTPTAQRSQPMYAGYWLLKIQMAPLDADNIEERAAITNQHKITSARSSYTPWGETINDDNYGTCGLVFIPFHSQYRLDVASFRGDGVEVTFNLPRTPAVANGTNNFVYVDRTLQTYTADYTISVAASTVIFGVAPAAGEEITVIYAWEETC